MLLEIAIGDAMGAGFEYAKPTKARPNDLSQYRSHPKWRQIPGAYTDDTEMSIAIAELLVEGARWNPSTIAEKFVHVFKRNNQRTGYAARFYEFLCSVNNGSEFLAKIKPDSEKSGAAMRVCPLAVVKDTDKMLEMVEIQARVTHNTDAAVTAAKAVALAAHAALWSYYSKQDLGVYAQGQVPGDRFGHDWSQPWKGKVGPPGCESAHAAIYAVASSESMTEILTKCIDFEGDVDTVAAMAMGIGSCCTDIKQDLPENLILTLENGPYGKDYLTELDRKLMALAT